MNKFIYLIILLFVFSLLSCSTGKYSSKTYRKQVKVQCRNDLSEFQKESSSRNRASLGSFK